MSALQEPPYYDGTQESWEVFEVWAISHMVQINEVHDWARSRRASEQDRLRMMVFVMTRLAVHGLNATIKAIENQPMKLIVSKSDPLGKPELQPGGKGE